MKKLLFALLFLGCCFRAHAANCLIPNGASVSTIQAAISAASSNSCTGTSGSNVAQLSAGSYNISSSLGIPCPTSAGMILQGPVVPMAKYTNDDGYTHLGYTPTAVFTPSGNVSLPSGQQMIITSGNCSGTTTIQYIEANGGHRDPDGGGAVYVPNNAQNITIQRNWFHGNWANTSGGNFIDSLIFLDGGQGEGGPLKTNIFILWNRLGGTGDCQNIMTGENYDGNSEEAGGSCNAIGTLGSATNLWINNNVIYYQEQGLKFFEGGCDPDSGAGNCNNFTTNNLFILKNRQVEYNDFSTIHRIPMESQQTPVTSFIQYNSWHDAYLGCNPSNCTIAGSWIVSVPESGRWYCGTQAECPGQTDNTLTSNLFLWNTAQGGTNGVTNVGNINAGSGPTIEFWQGEYANNLSQGYAGCAMQFGYDAYEIVNIIARMYNVNTYGFTCNEEGINNFPKGAVQAGNFNTYNYGINSGGASNSWQGTLSSLAPTITPSGGSFSGSQTVTLTDTGYTSSNAIPGYATGYGPQGNTGIWYTTDGSTPVPGQGTAQRVDSGGSFVISSTGTTTVKAVGMWGAANQPTSYTPNFAFVPSAVVSASFAGSGGTPTVNAPTFNPGPQTFGTALSVTIATTTSGATIRYTTDGSTPTNSSPIYSAPVPLTSTTTLQAFATLSGYLPSSITTGQYTYSLFLGNPIQNSPGGTYQNSFNWVYAVTSTASAGYSVASCSLNIPTGQVITGSASTDCVVALAPTPTTIANTPICTGTYSNAGATSGPGLVTIPMTGCGILPPGTAYWLGAITNDPLGPSPYGFWNCGGGCTPTPIPTVGNGTYNGFYGGGTYGNYSNLNASALLTSSSQLQPTVSLNLTTASSPMAATPIISPGTETFSGTITVSIADATPSAVIHYTTDGTTPSSASPVYSASFPINATTTVNAIAIATGYTDSSLASATYTLAVASVSSVYLSTTTNLNWTVLGVPVQFSAVVLYTDGTQTQISCAGNTVGCKDSRGTYISSWVSQYTGVGTIAASGLFTPVSITSVGANGQQGLDIIQAMLVQASGATVASSFWYEVLARSANQVIQGGTLDGITVF